MKLLAFAASHRPESLNHKLVTLAANEARKLDVEVEILLYGALDMPLYDDTKSANPPAEHKKLAEYAKNVDGILLSLPEYNWSFPANLKNIIDWTSIIKTAPLAGKTVFLMSATTGGRGGILGLQQIKPPLEHLGMFIFNKAFPLSSAGSAFAENGELIDQSQAKQLANFVQDYVAFTKKISANSGVK